jgi:hypothetical protein
MKINIFSLAALLLVPSYSKGNTLQSYPQATSPASDDWLYIQGNTNSVRKLSPLYYQTPQTSAAGYGILNGATIDLWGAKAIPSGTVVGTTDTQALTNKTYNGNTITAGTGTLTLGTQTLSISGSTTGQIPISNGTTVSPETISGDSAITSAGVMTNTGINGVNLATLGNGPLIYTAGVPALIATPQQGQIALAAQAGPSQYQSTYDYTDGAAWVSAGSTTSGAFLFVDSMNQPSGYIKSVSVDINAVGSGALAIDLLRDNGDGTMDVIDTKTVTIIGTGVSTFYGGVSLPNWTVTPQNKIGIQTVTSGATVRYSATSGFGGYRSYSGTASGTGLSMVTGSTTANTSVFYRVTTTVQVPTPYGKCILAKTEFPVLPTNFVNGGGWTFSPGTRAASCSTTGYTNILYENAQYGLDKRTITWTFSIGTTADILAFVTDPIEGGTQLGSVARVNGTSGAIELMTYWNGGSTGPTTVQASAAFAPAANTKYVAQWVRNADHSQTFTVFNMAGTSLASVTRISTLNFSSGPTYNYDIGAMDGAPGVVVVSGSASVYSYSHIANTAERPWLYICGDSITDGFAAGGLNSFGSLLRSTLGSYNVAISGVEGAVSTGTSTRMGQEILKLRPRNVMIYVGTNSDGNMNSYIPYMIILAKGIGANVYICGNPTNSTRNAVIFAQPGYATTIDFAAVLCVSGVSGTTLITSLYNNLDSLGNTVNDSIHPGPTGHIAMYNQILAQAPELGNPSY